MVCYYVAAGRRCIRHATDWRRVPLRTDLPSPDHVEVPLCDLHAQAVDIWAQAQITRAALSTDSHQRSSDHWCNP